MIYTDPIYGTVEIHEPIILDIIQSPTFQRLKGIEQGWYYEPYFPETKKHSRFDHSIGVYLLLKKYWASLEEQISWLIHDVSHGTFSHCLDYVFTQENQKKQDHQDNIFESFIKKTDIADILKQYNLDIDYIIDDTHFPLKETTLPDICADRIDYILRDAFCNWEISSAEIFSLLDHLITKDNTWIFTDLESAKTYAEIFHRTNEKYYSGIESALMHQTVGYCLKHAWEKWYLHMDDFYTTDQQVLDKITAHIATDDQLNIYWQRMNNKIPYTNDPNDFDYNVFCKSRVVDPLFMDGNDVKKISDIDDERKITVQTKTPPKEYFLKFEK